MSRSDPDMPSLRILLILHDFEPGGAERTAIRLASRWAELGADVSVVCGSQRGGLRPLLGSSVRWFEPMRQIARSFGSRARLAIHASHVARRLAPDVILLPGNYYAGMAGQLKFQLGRRCPPIIIKLSNALSRPGRGTFGQGIFGWSLALKTAFARRIVVMSPELLEEARSRLPWRDGKYAVIAQPVLDDRRSAPRRRAIDPLPTIVAAGRLVPQKNFPVLIDAVTRLDRPVRLIIHGEGPDRSKLEQMIDANGMTGRAELPGYSEALSESLARADLFVLSSDYEGFPAVLIEAIAAGTPAVATNCSAAVAPILDRAGLDPPVPVRDAEALARAISQALDRPADPAALRSSVERFCIGPSAEAYLALFRSLSPCRSEASCESPM